MDYARLRLKHHGDSAKLEEILQMQCREKCGRKLPDLCAVSGFIFPATSLAEMATSEAVARVHAGMVSEGEEVLDMTFGLGVDSFAMAGKGCKVTAVELDEHAYDCGKHNAGLLFPGQIELHHADSVKWLEESGRSFDTIFIDPQRRDASGRHFSLSQCQPDVTQCLPLLLSRSGRVIVKMSPMADIKAVRRELGVSTSKVTLIGTPKECKELVVEMSASASGTVDCVTIGKGVFSFTEGEGGASMPGFADPTPGAWLLQPFPAVMKAASLGSLRHIPFAKIAPDTNLFVDDGATDGFPGERMMIMEVLPFDKQTVRTLRLKFPVINVAVRNFPLSAPELVKKLKVKEGGTEMLHGVTLADGRKMLIVTGMPETV